ncbi:MAG TPA: hypothetical protein VFQ44_20980 [Streptosporangiaceae bacterium]|nr:hypothetical protein [Streptosporangiaceae bacterium]
MEHQPHDLRGLSLYGFVFSAFLLGTMVGIVAAASRSFSPASAASR